MVMTRFGAPQGTHGAGRVVSGMPTIVPDGSREDVVLLDIQGKYNLLDSLNDKCDTREIWKGRW